MALFGLFGSREEREREQLAKLGRKLTEKYGPPENRQKVIEQLRDLGTPGALGTLCLRFTVNAEPGITDHDEKERARAILIEAGDDALPPIQQFLREREDGIGWALQALAEIAPAEKVLEIVVGELTRLSRVYTRDPEKKLTLLTWLSQHHAGARSSALEGALGALLEDFSDDVRIAAARTLAGLEPSEAGREGLIQLLLRDKDNARVRGEVLEALATLGADVKGFRPSVEPLLVEPFHLDREGRVKKRG